jgi:hypothetical protein
LVTVAAAVNPGAIVTVCGAPVVIAPTPVAAPFAGSSMRHVVQAGRPAITMGVSSAPGA